MSKPRALFICGSPNQTSQMHKISEQLTGYDCYFTPYYASGFLYLLTKIGILDFTIMGGVFKRKALEYFDEYKLKTDIEGQTNRYDLVFTCQDLIIPKNILNSKIVLVQEGMTDPETIWYKIVKLFHLPRWAASTAMTGLSDAYDIFCVASEAYKNLFISKGVKPEKIRVTGMPNFDNYSELLTADFPHENFILVATSDMRETYKYENRKKLIQKAVEIAKGRKLIFKLHPNENIERATAEINRYAPGALVYHNVPIEQMIPKCSALVTRYSSVVYKALVLGKEVISDIPADELKRLMPIQNGGKSARNISVEAKRLISEGESEKIIIVKDHFVQRINVIQKFLNKIKFAKAKHS
jgi:hypothetical protein